MKKILIATKNPGKLLEYRELVRDLPLEFITLKDLGISEEPEEDQLTFEGNAIKKVEFYGELTNLPVLAEDSGLEIDYLNGEPGVLSRRWPGYKATDEELIQMTLKKLKGVPWEKRGAQFRVVLALKFPGKKDIFTGEGIMRGILKEKPSKKIIPGFPFRALFYNPKVDKVLGEMTMKEEAKIAHRKIALERLMPIFLK